MGCICVLGMHRSGTSCLTGIMQNLGVELGEVFTENLFNKKGNRENGRIVFLNDMVLKFNGGAWENPVRVTKWNDAQIKERDSIIAELSGRNPNHWGFKDTRTLFTLPFWEDAIGTPRFIGTFRHPHRVALSLNHRDQSPIERNYELWYRYNVRLLELARLHDFPITDFDQSDEAYVSDVLGKLVKLGLDPGLTAQGRAFFDPALRNQAGSSVAGVELPEKIVALYAELRAYAAQPAEEE